MSSSTRVTCYLCFFFNDTATTEIYTLSLHDALPIWDATRCQSRTAVDRAHPAAAGSEAGRHRRWRRRGEDGVMTDRKSTRLNSSHANISYAVFCLKKKMNILILIPTFIFPHHRVLMI